MSGTLETEAPGHAGSARSCMCTMNCARNPKKNLILPRSQCDASKISFPCMTRLECQTKCFPCANGRKKSVTENSNNPHVPDWWQDPNIQRIWIPGFANVFGNKNGPHHLIRMLNNRIRRNKNRQTVPELNSIRERQCWGEIKRVLRSNLDLDST